LNGLLAQLVEQGTLNAWVGGSSPSQPTYVSESEGMCISSRWQVEYESVSPIDCSMPLGNF
jgi:hypothetical protein